METVELSNHHSTSRVIDLAPQHGLHNHRGSSDDTSPARSYQAVRPLPKSQEPNSASNRIRTEAKSAMECGPCSLSPSMQDKMVRMGQDLDALKSTIYHMQGVQDAQNKIIGRLLLMQRRGSKAKGSLKDETGG
jgi:hypothetical protein